MFGSRGPTQTENTCLVPGYPLVRSVCVPGCGVLFVSVLGAMVVNAFSVSVPAEKLAQHVHAAFRQHWNLHDADPHHWHFFHQ